MLLKIKLSKHSAIRYRKELNLIWVNLEDESKTTNSIIVPGGFGLRGTEGMIKAAEWAQTNKIPYLGICLGVQISAIEFARHVCNLPQASSSEFQEHCPNPVVIFIPEIDKTTLGGTMKLGIRPTIFQPGSE
jgi:CTP synthase